MSSSKEKSCIGRCVCYLFHDLYRLRPCRQRTVGTRDRRARHGSARYRRTGGDGGPDSRNPLLRDPAGEDQRLLRDGVRYPFKLAEEFTKQFPNVTWNIKQDQFTNLINETPRLLSGDNPPDLIRLPTMVSFAKQGLLKNLDGYAKAFGWDKWPVPQLDQNRVAADGTRGSGSLYAMGLNYSLTGIFYNKKLAAQIGMTEPPKTLAEFEDLLAKAKAAGLQPIMEWGSAKSGMGLAFPLQNLMAAVGPVGPINDWIFQKKGATIDTPSNLVAAQHLEQWIKNGYFPPDINAIEYTDAAARFTKGEGVFTFNGDWQNAGYDAAMPGNVGFFLMPPAKAGGSRRRCPPR